MGHSRPFFLYFRLFKTVDSKHINVWYKSFPMTAFEQRTLVSEATALPQPLPSLLVHFEAKFTREKGCCDPIMKPFFRNPAFSSHQFHFVSSLHIFDPKICVRNGMKYFTSSNRKTNFALIEMITGHRLIVTRFGNFWKFLVTNILTKVTQIFGDTLGYFERHNFRVATVVGSLWATFVKNWLLFISTSGHTGRGFPTPFFELWNYLYNLDETSRHHIRSNLHLKIDFCLEITLPCVFGLTNCIQTNL